jgi:hypothetical protein
MTSREIISFSRTLIRRDRQLPISTFSSFQPVCFLLGKTQSNEPVLPNLITLDLTGNPLGHLNNDTFKWLRGSQLQHLILHKCNIQYIDTGTDRFIFLQGKEQNFTKSLYVLQSAVASMKKGPLIFEENIFFSQ